MAFRDSVKYSRNMIETQPILLVNIDDDIVVAIIQYYYLLQAPGHIKQWDLQTYFVQTLLLLWFITVIKISKSSRAI